MAMGNFNSCKKEVDKKYWSMETTEKNWPFKTKIKIDGVFGMKQTIDDTFSNSRASNISPQFPSGSRPPSPYRYFNRQGSQNTFNRSLSLFRSYVSFFLVVLLDPM